MMSMTTTMAMAVSKTEATRLLSSPLSLLSMTESEGTDLHENQDDDEEDEDRLKKRMK